MITALLSIVSSVLEWFNKRRENKISDAKADYLKFRSQYELNKEKRLARSAAARDIDYILRHQQKKPEDAGNKS